MLTELLTGGIAAAGAMPGQGTAPVPNAATQNINTKAKGNVVKGLTVDFGSETSGDSLGNTTTGSPGGAAAPPAMDWTIVLAAMVFILVLIAIVALLG